MDNNQIGIPSIVTVVLFLAFMVWASMHFSTGVIPINANRDPKKLLGQEAPEIEFEDSVGKKESIKKERGTVLLLNFWTSWCERCMKEMPSLKMLENHFARRGLVILAFNIEESKDKIQGKIEGGSFPKNLIFNFTKEHLQSYNLKNLPLSILIDSSGTVRQVFTGPQNWMDYKMIHLISDLTK